MVAMVVIFQPLLRGSGRVCAREQVFRAGFITLITLITTTVVSLR